MQHSTTPWRRLAATALGTTALISAGLHAPAAAVVVEAGPGLDCLVVDHEASHARGGPGLDHSPVTPALQARVEARTARLLASDRVDGSRQITVPVRAHVMAAKDGAGNITDEQVAAQVSVMNDAFAGAYSEDAAATGIRFVLKSTDRFFNDTWHADGKSKAYRSKTRQGKKNTLNIWFVGWGNGTLGIATFPWEYKANKAVDGVRVHYDTVPGGSLAPYDLGQTATHEIGHWMGLYHTFQAPRGKSGCVGKNDRVADTPAQSAPTDGCPEGADTCPGKRGLDPIHNFMDYSYDACMNQFTPGQKKRMRQMWSAYRG